MGFGPLPAQRPSEPRQQGSESANAAPPQNRGVKRAPQVVFLDLDRSMIGTLVEAKLRDKNLVKWWPRHATYRLLREVELSTAIDIAPPEDERGQPPLPDAMIVLRTQSNGNSSLAELVVCEPKLGLRLGSKRMPLSSNVEQDVETLATAAIASLSKLDERVSRLWGVPPFRCSNLGGEDGALRHRLAQEIGEAILKQPGAFLVELDYAYAIAEIRRVAGTEQSIRRQRPWFLLGEYRSGLTDWGPSLEVSLTLYIEESAVRPWSLVPLPTEEAVEQLRRHVTRGVGFNHASAVFDNPAGELKLLEAVRREAQKAADLETEVALAETSLLLISGDQQLRNETASLLGKLAWQEWRKAEELPPPAALPAAPAVSVIIEGTKPTAEIERQYEQALVRAINHSRRSLAHANIVAESLPSPPPHGQNLRNVPRIPVVLYGGSIVSPRSTSSDSLKALARPLREARARLALRMAPIHAYHGETGDVYMIRELPPPDRRAAALRLILELKDYPQPARRIQQYVLSGLTMTTGWAPEDDERFLKQVEAIDHPAIAAAVKNARQQLASQAQARQPQIFAPASAPRRQQPQSSQPPKPPMSDVPAQSDAQVAFKPLALPWQRIHSQTRCDMCLPAGPDVDLFGAAGQILLMKKKGEARLLWQGDLGLNFRNFLGAPLACYDGKYAWIPASRPLKLPQLVIVDPQSGKVTEVTKEHGLPEGPVPVNYQPVLAAAPLASGRVLLVGTFGQTWLAIATFDPDKGPSVKVIHECVEQLVPDDDDQWRSAKLVFTPLHVTTLSGKLEGSEKVEQRVLVGRGSAGRGTNHPLLVNPETGQVEVLTAEYPAFGTEQPFAYQGALYSSIPSQQGRAIWRVGFPDFQPKLVAEQSVKGNSFNLAIGMEPDRVHLVHDQWYTGPSWDEPLKPLRGTLPGKPLDRLYLLRSNHYGWIVQTMNSEPFAVEFLDLPEDEPREPKNSGNPAQTDSSK